MTVPTSPSLSQLRACLAAALSPDPVREHEGSGFLVSPYLDVPCEVSLRPHRGRSWVIVSSLVPWLLEPTGAVLRELNDVNQQSLALRALLLGDGRVVVIAELPLASLDPADLLAVLLHVSQVRLHLSLRAGVLLADPS